MLSEPISLHFTLENIGLFKQIKFHLKGCNANAEIPGVWRIIGKKEEFRGEKGEFHFLESYRPSTTTRLIKVPYILSGVMEATYTVPQYSSSFYIVALDSSGAIIGASHIFGDIILKDGIQTITGASAPSDKGKEFSTRFYFSLISPDDIREKIAALGIRRAVYRTDYYGGNPNYEFKRYD